MSNHDARDEYLEDVTGDVPDWPDDKPLAVCVEDMPDVRQRRPNVAAPFARAIIAGDTKAYRLLPAQRNRSRALITAITSGVSFLYLASSDQTAIPTGTAPDGVIVPYLFGGGVGCAQVELTHTGEVWVRSDGTAAHTIGVLAELYEDLPEA